MNFFYAIHHLDDRGIEIIPAANAAQHRVEHSSGAMNVEAHLDQTVDHLLNLRIRCALLHHD